MAETLKLAVSPGHFVRFTGGLDTFTFSFTVSVALWVMPGDEQDRLEALGALEPPGYPGSAPP